VEGHPKICELQFKPFEDCKRRCIVSYYFIHKLPVDRATEVFEPSTDQARLLVPTEIFFSVLGLGFFGGTSLVWVVVAFVWPTLPGPGRQSNEPMF